MDEIVQFGKERRDDIIDNLDEDGFPFIENNMRHDDIEFNGRTKSRRIVQKVVLSSNDEGENGDLAKHVTTVQYQRFSNPLSEHSIFDEQRTSMTLDFHLISVNRLRKPTHSHGLNRGYHTFGKTRQRGYKESSSIAPFHKQSSGPIKRLIFNWVDWRRNIVKALLLFCRFDQAFKINYLGPFEDSIQRVKIKRQRIPRATQIHLESWSSLA